MAGDTSSNIFINIDTAQAMAQLRALEKEITALNRALIIGTKTAAQAQSKYAQSLLHNVNATGQWTASMTRMRTATEQFATSLDRSKLSLKEYFRYGVASTRTFGKVFGNEYDTVSKLVEKRVKTLQQQYVQLGRDAQGAMNALKFTPKALNYRDVTTQLMLATQRQQIFNKLMDDGATKLLNFGKNTQWAGRQLMVGFTIPLTIFGSQAIKTFKEIETQVIRFKKVYGDIFTDQGATDQALKNIRALADEYTKYGLKVSDTIKTAADAAAAGFSGKGLETLVEQTNKLAVLGGVTQEKALETTIALKNAFQIDTGQMSGTIDFLNAVENQTVVALDDLTEAIPRVAPVVQQLGGDVKDLAYFMAAMQEGGISAAQGANALKSGLASLINPSKKAAQAAADLGINLKGIIEENQGNLRNIVTAFAKSLQPLTDLQRTRIIEQIFGKYQFARISALLNNIGKEGTQAARVLQLTNASVEELAILSQRELKIQADSPMNKMAGAVEKLKAAIAPIGKLFAEVLTPVIEYLGKLAEKFNNLPDGIKKAIAIILGVIGGIGPVFLMTFGLVANAIANSLKGVNLLRKGYQQLAYGSSDTALKTQYLTQEELENVSITNSLYSKHEQLSAAYRLEAQSLRSLIGTYAQANTAMGTFATNNPGLFIPGRGPVRRFADGTTNVPGPRGAGDVVPSMLSPGESVIPAKQTQKYAGFISAIIKDKVPGFIGGRFPLFGNAANAATQSIRGVAPGQIKAAQLRFAGMSEAEQNALIQSRMGNVFKTSRFYVAKNVPDKPNLLQITVKSGADDNQSASFLLERSKISKLDDILETNMGYYQTDPKRQARLDKIKNLDGILHKDSPEGKLYYAIKRKGFVGKVVDLDQVSSRMPASASSRTRTTPTAISARKIKIVQNIPQTTRDYFADELSQLREAVRRGDISGVNETELYRILKIKPQDHQGFEAVVGRLRSGAGGYAASHIQPRSSLAKQGVSEWEESNLMLDTNLVNAALKNTFNAPNSRIAAESIIEQIAQNQSPSSSQKLLQWVLAQRVQPGKFFDRPDLTKTFAEFPRYADGVLSVPGPKGAGDIQPAMLSPGEAVIPAKQSQKYMPLIQSIISGKVPGFEKSNVPGAPGGYTRTASGLFIPANADITRETRLTVNSMSNLRKITNRLTGAFKSTDLAANNASDALGKDKTRGFSGWLRGYGKVPGTIVDEATGQERRASAAERTNMRQLNRMNFAQKMMPLQMAGMAIPMAAGMVAAKNPEGGIAKNMDLIMMISMLTMLLPMLNSPLKMLAATAVGLTVAFKMQAAAIKKSMIEGQNQAKAMTMTTDNLEALGKITGNVSIAQVEEAKRKSRVTEITPVSMDFGKNLITNEDFGKQLKATFDKTVKDLGASAAVESLSSQLATAVSQGVLTAVQAESIAVAITRDLNDARLELNVRSRLTELIGPNGQDLLNNPLEVQLRLIASGKELQAAAFKNLQNVIGQQRSGLVGIGGNEAKQLGLAAIPAAGAALYGGGSVANALNVARTGQEAAKIGTLGRVLTGARALRTAGLVASGGISATGAGAPIGLISAAISTVIFGGIELGVRKWQQGNEKKAIAKAAGLFQGVASANLKASQQSLDAFNVEISNAIKNLEVKKKYAKTAEERATIEGQILDLEKKRTEGGLAIRKSQGDILRSVASQYDQVDKRTFWETAIPGGTERGALREKFMESFQVGLQEKFKGNAAATADLTSLMSLLQGKYGKGEGDAITLKIQTLIDSDVLTPAEAAAVVQNLSKDTKKAEKQLDLLVDVQGTEGLQRLATIMTFIPDEKNRKQLFIDIQKKNKEDADATLAGIEELIKIPKYIGIVLNMETNPDDYQQMMKIGKEIGQLKKVIPADGEITLDVLTKVQQDLKNSGAGVNTTLENAIKQWEVLEKLPKELRFQAMITLTTLKTSDSFDTMVNREISAAYAKKYPKARRVTKKQLDAFAKANPQVRADAEAKALYEMFGYKVPDTSKNGGPTTTTNDNKTKQDYSWLTDIVQRLKLVKESSIDALKPMESIRKFFNPDTPSTYNDYLANQAGAIDQIRKSANEAGIVLNENFVDILRNLDPEQFVLWSKQLFKLDDKGRIKGLKQDFIDINAALRTLNAGELVDKIKTENNALDTQVKAYQILKNEKYNQLEIERILADETMTKMIADQGYLSLSIEERKQLNDEIARTLRLRTQESLVSLDKDTGALQIQMEAFDKLNALGIDHEVILEVIKNRYYAMAVVAGVSIDEITSKIKTYLDIVKKAADQQKTWEDKTQEAIDRNVAALDLQARALQNAFDTNPVVIKAKADIKSAQNEIDSINRTIQDKQNDIDKINLEVKYDKYYGDAVLADMQEQINDARRVIEMEFDRPIQALQDRSGILSNDLTLMDKAAESINAKYDAQEKALSAISEVNQDIINQQKQQIGLADALTQGDISAAATAAQEMRQSAAEAASRNAGGLIATAREAELARLTSASGMTRAQIEQEQFNIGQKIYQLELNRKKNQDAIVKIEDDIYNRQEKREEKLKSIRDIEKQIDDLRVKDLAPAQKRLDDAQRALDIKQAELDAELANIEAQKDKWEALQIALDAYKAKLDEINNGPLATMLDLINQINAALAAAGSGIQVNPNAGGGSSAAAAAAAAASAAAAEKAAADAAAVEAESAAAEAEATAAEAEAAAAAEEAAIAIEKITAEAEAAAASAAAANEANRAAIVKKLRKAGKPIPKSLLKKPVLGGGGGGGGRLAAQLLMYGGKVKPMATGGRVGSDSVSTLLTPGEFVVNKAATKEFLPLLSMLNNTKYPSMLGNRIGGAFGNPSYSTSGIRDLVAPTYVTPRNNIINATPISTSNSSAIVDNSSMVYNYNVGITVGGTNVDPNTIANSVINEIKYIDAQRIRRR